jgi:hypothetical protein
MTKAYRLVIAALIAVGLPASAAAATPASAATAHQHRVALPPGIPTNVISGLSPSICLDDQHSGTGNGNNVDVFPCNGSGAQIWGFQQVAGSSSTLGKVYEIHVGVGSNMCLDDYAGAVGSPSRVDIWQCNGHSSQQWVLRGTLNYGATLRPMTDPNNYCLDDAHSGTAPYNPVDIYQCNGTLAQWWAVYTD